MSLCIQYINSTNSYCTSARVVRLGGSACTPNKGSCEGTASLHSTKGVGVGVLDPVRHAGCVLDIIIIYPCVL